MKMTPKYMPAVLSITPCPLISQFRNHSNGMLLIFLVLMSSGESSCSSDSNAPASVDIFGGTPVLRSNLTDGGHWATDPTREAFVTANHSPQLKDACKYRMYVEFNKHVAGNKYSLAPYNKVIGKQYVDKETNERYEMNPKDLCIRTDSEKNIDMNEFDCLPNKGDADEKGGYCGCGSRWSRIDLNDPASNLGLDSTRHSYEYKALIGLDKFLVIERGDEGMLECVAERFGHCTLKPETKKHVTRCAKGFKCRNISIWNPIQKTAILNNRTKDWYGICVSQRTPDTLIDPYNASVRKSINLTTVIFTSSIVIIMLACQTNDFLNDNTNNYDNKRRNKCHSKFIS